MSLLDKTLLTIISIELTNHSLIFSNGRLASVDYITNALLLMPWFFRYPLSVMILSINLVSLIFKRKVFIKLERDQSLLLWNKLSKFPGYSSLKRLLRTLILLSAYSNYYYEKN